MSPREDKRLPTRCQAANGQAGMGEPAALLGCLEAWRRAAALAAVRRNSVGGIPSGGLGGLLDQFQQNGQGDTVNCWCSPGDNKPIDNQQLCQALGPDVLKELAEKTGLSEQNLLSRLSQDLPKAVNDLTQYRKVQTQRRSPNCYSRQRPPMRKAWIPPGLAISTTLAAPQSVSDRHRGRRW